jgi:hypothetical protein
MIACGGGPDREPAPVADGVGERARDSAGGAWETVGGRVGSRRWEDAAMRRPPGNRRGRARRMRRRSEREVELWETVWCGGWRGGGRTLSLQEE